MFGNPTSVRVMLTPEVTEKESIERRFTIGILWFIASMLATLILRVTGVPEPWESIWVFSAILMMVPAAHILGRGWDRKHKARVPTGMFRAGWFAQQVEYAFGVGPAKVVKNPDGSLEISFTMPDNQA